MALFRYHGRATVAIASGSYDPNIPKLEFQQYRNGKWVDVSRRVLTPSAIKAVTNKESDYDRIPMATYTLPQHGTTIVVHTRRGTNLTLRWSQGRFAMVHGAS